MAPRGHTMCILLFAAAIQPSAAILAEGNNFVVEENNSLVAGNNSLVAGNNSLVAGNNSLVAGNNSLVAGNNSFKERGDSFVEGNNSFVEWNNTLVEWNDFLVEMDNSSLEVNNSLAEGNITSEEPSIIIGQEDHSCRNDTLMTYNVGLAPTVPGFEDRRKRIPDVIGSKAQYVDFMCIQELWFQEDIDRVIEAVEKDLPYQYTYLHYDNTDLDPNRPPCDTLQMTNLQACVVATNCRRATDLRQCIVTECADHVYAMPVECLACISMTVSGNDILDAYKYCTIRRPDVPNAGFNAPGLFIASRRPFTARYVNYHAGYRALLPRGYIEAQFENGSLIVCTHLSAIFKGTYEVRLPYSSYEDEQKAEIRVLLESFHGTQHVLLGDLNTGPERNHASIDALDMERVKLMDLQGKWRPGEWRLAGEAPANYDLLMSTMGYEDPYMEEDGRCTYCERNPVLVNQGSVRWGDVLEHILLKDLDRVPDSTERLFDDSEVGPLSDHYGVSVAVCRP